MVRIVSRVRGGCSLGPFHWKFQVIPGNLIQEIVKFSLTVYFGALHILK
jgi:hypothetical protein